MIEDTRVFSVSLPDSLYRKIKDMAKKENRSKAAQIRHLIQVALPKEEVKETNEKCCR